MQLISTILLSFALMMPIHAKETSFEIINLNTATVEQLATLTGVGTKKAEDIIKYREANKGFKNVEEFAKVHGIGAKTFENNKARLTVTPPIFPK